MSLSQSKRATYKRAYRAERMALFKLLLGGQCVSCGSTDNLEIDHVIPKDKSFTLAMKCEFSLDRCFVELQKCQLLCHDCHWDKTRSDRLPTHGKPSRYNNQRCRCKDCTEAWRIYIYSRKHKA